MAKNPLDQFAEAVMRLRHVLASFGYQAEEPEIHLARIDYKHIEHLVAVRSADHGIYWQKECGTRKIRCAGVEIKNKNAVEKLDEDVLERLHKCGLAVRELAEISTRNELLASIAYWSESAQAAWKANEKLKAGNDGTT